MKRLIVLVVALIAVEALTGCYPQLTAQDGGFWSGRNGGTITVDNRGNVGVDSWYIIDAWNWTAGRQLLTTYGRGDPNGVYAQVRFEILSPICAFGNCNDRRAAWVDVHNKTNGWYNQCTVYFDPWWPPPASWENTLEHEVGHCLGFVPPDPYVDAYNPDYRGVLSYFDFQTQAGWWRQDDVSMLTAAGYGVR